MQNTSTFGERIRNLRVGRQLPIRKVAAFADIDPSTLSKIERSERYANETLIDRLAELFQIEKRELLNEFISDKIAREMMGIEQPEEILQLIEAKMKYFKNRRQLQGTINFEDDQ